jgi:hypothetical protein
VDTFSGTQFDRLNRRAFRCFGPNAQWLISLRSLGNRVETIPNEINCSQYTTTLGTSCGKREKWQSNTSHASNVSSRFIASYGYRCMQPTNSNCTFRGS